MSKQKRVIIDCRDFPNEIGCTLLISGSEREVLKAAVRHAVEEHGHQDTPELRKQVKAFLKDESNENLTMYTTKKNKTNKKKGITK